VIPQATWYGSAQQRTEAEFSWQRKNVCLERFAGSSFLRHKLVKISLVFYFVLIIIIILNNILNKKTKKQNIGYLAIHNKMTTYAVIPHTT